MIDIFVMARHPLHGKMLKAKIVARFEKQGYYPLYRVKFRDACVADFMQRDCTLVGKGQDHLHTIPTHSDFKGDYFATQGVVKGENK